MMLLRVTFANFLRSVTTKNIKIIGKEYKNILNSIKFFLDEENDQSRIEDAVRRVTTNGVCSSIIR